LEIAVSKLVQTFEITDEGAMDDYLGVKVEKQEDGSFKQSQTLLIKNILQAMGFNKRSMSKDTPEFSSKILHQSVDGPTHDTPWDY